uniref:Uncharacterized protein n=1 Tax=Octopus bimaculoides TaxID=37653 RepID=A0A0L8HM41_OCTBM
MGINSIKCILPLQIFCHMSVACNHFFKNGFNVKMTNETLQLIELLINFVNNDGPGSISMETVLHS